MLRRRHLRAVPRDRGDRHHVVVIGAGFGGLAVVRALRTAPVDITVVDTNNFHTFQPLLYQVATAGLGAEDVAHPVRSIFRGHRTSHVETVMGEVVDIDTATRSVTTGEGDHVGYDTLVIAAGAISNDFGIEGVAENTVALKTLEDALQLNQIVMATFERASRQTPPLAPGALDIVISGGGPTGVELAGGLSELYTNVLADDFPELPVDEARIVVVEMADRLLSPFSEKSSERAHRTLERKGVEVRCGVGVQRVEPHCVALDDGSTIAADTCVWAAGVKAHPIALALGIEVVKGGRIPVDADLSVTGVDDVYAIGDIAAAPNRDGSPLPQVAQPAIQGGKHVARQIVRRLDGQDTVAFDYTDKGSMATIGRHSAVAELPGGLELGGYIGWVSWLLLHLTYLVGFRNRLVVLVNWSWNYLTFDRPSRLLSGSAAIALDRDALDRDALDRDALDRDASGESDRPDGQ